MSLSNSLSEEQRAFVLWEASLPSVPSVHEKIVRRILRRVVDPKVSIPWNAIETDDDGAWIYHRLPDGDAKREIDAALDDNPCVCAISAALIKYCKAHTFVELPLSAFRSLVQVTGIDPYELIEHPENIAD